MRRNRVTGPEIRFPFRLRIQPVFCGLEGFELSCFNNNTHLQIPSSSSNSSHAFYVQEISFLHSVVTIIDADETKCPLKTLLSLNVTGSKFAFSQFALNNNQTLALVNCTEKIAQSSSLIEEVVPIDCTSDDKNFAYDSMDALPSNCSRWRTASDPFVSQGREINLEIEEDGDEEIAKKLAIVGLWCIQWNPIDRPFMTMVMQMLEGDVHCLEIPPNKPFVASDIEMVQKS
ncbi:hypothetical protein JRO89_XS05G0245200 [Xanthoceras sorbifolium]|uniref:RING-type E3 ubiquitin transferase n=1 Tax=Xanthoceras sorbifolium TaxID=99658 RepID=A0ABQ8I363_9ROSI|nr:hypothetical protein JRO89_XS05G0245200 [Xanthoceras sorbifolium]